MSITIHPQVLFNITTHILSNRVVNKSGSESFNLGILLGTFNPRMQSTDVVDSFETSFDSQRVPLNANEVEFLRDRLVMRLKGDQWNLFKNLDVVGWYLTSPNMPANLHLQLSQIVQESTLESQVNLFKYILLFNPTTKKETIYQHQSDELGPIQIQHVREPSTQEMITINSVQQQFNNADKNKSSLVVGMESQLNTIKQFEDLCEFLLRQLDHPAVANNTIILRDISEMLNSVPSQQQSEKQVLIEEYSKINLLGQYCLLQQIQKDIQVAKERFKYYNQYSNQ